jgi:hypothetical protein
MAEYCECGHLRLLHTGDWGSCQTKPGKDDFNSQKKCSCKRYKARAMSKANLAMRKQPAKFFILRAACEDEEYVLCRLKNGSQLIFDSQGYPKCAVAKSENFEDILNMFDNKNGGKCESKNNG